MSHLNDRTTNDLLVQLVEGQAALLKEFGEHKGRMEAKMEAVEATAKWSKIMTYCINPLIAIASSVAAHFGIPIRGIHP